MSANPRIYHRNPHLDILRLPASIDTRAKLLRREVVDGEHWEVRQCKWCLGEFRCRKHGARGHKQNFCSNRECKEKWSQRVSAIGRQLVAAAMAWRYARPTHGNVALSHLCRVLEFYHSEDAEVGRSSW